MNEVLSAYVEIMYPGSFYPEESIEKVEKRDPEAIAKKHPRAFSFQFFDLASTEIVVDGVKREVSGHRKNLSPKYFPEGKVMTVSDLRKLKGDYQTLISNMECNDWPKVVRCRTGNFQPFTEDCELLEVQP